MRALSFLGLILAACSGDTKTTPTDSGTPPTETVTTTEPTETTETTETTEPPYYPPADLTFVIEGVFEGTGIVLQAVDFSTGALGAELASASVTSDTVTVTVPPPAQEDLAPLNPYDTSTLAAFYLVGLFDDTSADGVHDPGEVFTGYSPAFVVFIQSDGGLSLPLKLFGLRSGWNALEIDLESGYPVALELDAIPVIAPEPSTEATVSGTWSAPVTTGTPAPPPWLGLVPVTDDSGLYADVLYDDPITAEWSITVAGEPPLSHQVIGDPYVADGTALELPVTFEDTDASGSLTPGDLILDAVCTADLRPVALAWFTLSDDLLLTFFTQARSGWLVVADPEGTLEILGTELGDLTIGGC